MSFVIRQTENGGLSYARRIVVRELIEYARFKVDSKPRKPPRECNVLQLGIVSYECFVRLEVSADSIIVR